MTDDEHFAPDGTPWRERAREFADVAMGNAIEITRLEGENHFLRGQNDELFRARNERDALQAALAVIKAEAERPNVQLVHLKRAIAVAISRAKKAGETND